jgi:hypothetical protein
LFMSESTAQIERRSVSIQRSAHIVDAKSGEPKTG